VWLTPQAAALPEGLAVGAALEGELALEIAGGGTLQLENVAALWRGRGPRSSELVVLSAHYDHLDRDAGGAIHNGADDNASGCAGLLALAEALAAYGPLERSVLLLWVSGEELGLYGSRAWCEAPDLPDGLVPCANINLDMIGRNAPERIELTPSPEHEHANPLARAALELVASEGFEPPVFVDRDFERSDQASFAERLGLPVVYLSAGEHPDYHEPSDDAELVDDEKIARITRVVLRLLDQMQSAPLEP
jgi:Zn-dependent M28 family amino/carboxypeptidase